MVKPRQEYSAASFLGQAGVEIYYPKANESFSLKGRLRFRRSGLLSGYLRVSATSENLEGSPIHWWDERKAVDSGPVPAEVDQVCVMSFKRA